MQLATHLQSGTVHVQAFAPLRDAAHADAAAVAPPLASGAGGLHGGSAADLVPEVGGAESLHVGDAAAGEPADTDREDALPVKGRVLLSDF